MKKILVIGATGNVGTYLVEYFEKSKTPYLGACRKITPSLPQVEYGKWIEFDIEIKKSFPIEDIGKIFFLRPSQISDVEKLRDFLSWCKSLVHLEVIVFMSVIGAQKMPWVPHRKIELEVEKQNLPYVFLRPSFFMQNFSGVHSHEIKSRNQVYVPAGNTRMSFVDVKDIALCAYKVLSDPKFHLKKTYEITGGEVLSYKEVATIFSNVLQRKIIYCSPNLLSFTFSMRKRGMKISYIFVMIMLYLVSRFKQPNYVTSSFKEITASKQTSFEDFVKRSKSVWS